MKGIGMHFSVASLALIALAIVGCGEDTAPMTTTDAGADMTTTGDMATPLDLGADGSTSIDMATPVDLGADGSAPVDMATPVDAGTDSGPTIPVCNNTIIEGDEECDDGNNMDGDGCDSECQSEEVRTAFRLVDMDILDPHAWVNIGACIDGTDLLNGQLETTMTTDDTGDGKYDLNIALSFLPLATGEASSNVQVSFPDCYLATGNCEETPVDPTPHAGIAANMSTGTCLTPVADTTRAAYGTIPTPEGPCFSANFGTTSFDVNGITLTLRDARFAAEYSGEPVSQLVTGLVQGFLTEADAEATTIPAEITFVGGMQLSALLAGGEGSCRTGAANDDRDTFTDGVTRGWYFYMSFTAEVVPSYTAL